jgi:hypothetical protein
MMNHLDKPYDILLNVLQQDSDQYKMNLISIIKRTKNGFLMIVL